MRAPGRERAIPAALGLAAFALAFVQRPGWATSDTKIQLHVAPGRFLSDVASTWTPSGGLGGVWSGQHAGYEFPMGPFFALGHSLGLSAWVVQRLWLGTVLALAAWGVVRLLDALNGRPRGVAHVVAGALILLNPFVVVYANRTTVTLLAYAALPWLLLAVHHGVREPRGWRWPATFALLVTATGPGVNAAVTGWVLVGPALLLLYEPWAAGVPVRAAGGFAARAVALTVPVSLWWLVAAWVQSSHGIDFLKFTEQPGTVWGTTSAAESVRLMGFWLSYVGVGFTGRPIPYFDDSRTLLFSPAVVVATLLVPALSFAGFAWTRRWRYGAFFLALALAGVLVMTVGFPDGTPLRRGLTYLYNHVTAVRFLRASYKAGPLLAVGLACLGGVAAAEAWRRIAPPPARWALLGGAGVLLALSAWPLVTGRAQDAQVSFRQVSPAWRAAARDLDAELAPNSRAMVLPGQLFAFYRWGGTVDPILPALAARPVAVRSIVPYADLRATDLLDRLDGLVHQRRLVPGQLAPLLDLASVGSVVNASDDDRARSGGPSPVAATADLRAQGLARPARDYGTVRRYDRDGSRGIVRVERRDAPIVVDGSADALAGLAAFGALPAGRTLRYAGDLSARELRTAADAPDAQIVISDSNRRRAFVPGQLEQNVGWTLAADEAISEDGLILDPFDRGSDGQTVAALRGAARLRAPFSPAVPQFPEHRPFAAFDRSTATAWLADRHLDAARHWIEIGFGSPRDVPDVVVVPYGDGLGRTVAMDVAGRRFSVHPGRNHLHVGLRGVSSLRLGIAKVAGGPGPGGLREVALPGLRLTEELRPPVLAETALAGRDLSRARLTYLFERTTGDDPFERDRAHGPWGAGRLADRGDAERTLHRRVALPAAREWRADAWVSVDPLAPDFALDALAGYHGPVRAWSSNRWHGRPGARASRALDGSRATSWAARRVPGVPAWIALRSPRELTTRRLVLAKPAGNVGAPTRVRVAWPDGRTGPLRVGVDGEVRLPAPVRTRELRIDVLGSTRRRSVGIGEIGGIAGLSRVREGAAADVGGRCGAVAGRIAARAFALRVRGRRSDWEAGRPLRAHGCGPPLTLRAGRARVVTRPGPFLVDRLRLTSRAPRIAGATATPGRVVDAGRAGRGAYTDVRLALARPAWLVLGEGFNRGWRATCDGRSLGAPVPVDGYANGWAVGRRCRDVSFAFAPNRLAGGGFVVSALAGVLCLVLLLAGARRGPTGVRGHRPADIARDRPRRWPPGRSALLAVVLAPPLVFVLGVGIGLAAALGVGLVVWRGWSGTTLALAAGVALGLLATILTLAAGGDPDAGNHATYAMERLGAHRAAVAALVLIAVALARSLAAARCNRATSAAGRTSGP